jgi:hypothetical protein
VGIRRCRRQLRQKRCIIYEAIDNPCPHSGGIGVLLGFELLFIEDKQSVR